MRFVAIFSVLLGVFFIAELTAPAQRYLVVPWTQELGAIGGTVASWFDKDTIASGSTIANPATGFGVTIVAGCNGVEATLILVAAIIAFPSSLPQKLVGIASGIVAVQVLNLVRVVSLYFIGQWSRPAFDFAHLYLWQAMIMLDVLIVWLVWLRVIQRTAPADA